MYSDSGRSSHRQDGIRQASLMYGNYGQWAKRRMARSRMACPNLRMACPNSQDGLSKSQDGLSKFRRDPS